MKLKPIFPVSAGAFIYFYESEEDAIKDINTIDSFTYPYCTNVIVDLAHANAEIIEKGKIKKETSHD